MLMRNRTFTLLMIGEIATGTGIWISIIANLKFMQHLVPSDLMKSLILMCGLFIGVLLSPQAGVWIDKYNKRTIIFLVGLFRCLAPVVMFIAIAYDSVMWMLLSVVILQVSASVYFPAVQAALPAIVPKAELLKANSVYFNISTLARVGGTAIAGVMVGLMDLFSLYAVSLVAYVLLVAITKFIHIPNHAETGGEGAASQSPTRTKEKIRFREIFPMIRNEPSISISLINDGVLTLFLGGFNLIILKFSEIQQSSSLMGWIYAIEGITILLFGTVAKRWIGTRNLVAASTLFMLLFAVSFVGMSFTDSRLLVLGSFVVFGSAVAFFFPMISTIFQMKLPAETQGRFFSFKGMLNRIMFQVALLATGACLDWFGLAVYMIVLAILSAASGVATFVYGRQKSLVVKQAAATEQQTAHA